MSSEHIVKSFDEELKQLSQMVAQMGGLAEAQLQAAIEALVARDAEGAARVVQGDERIDQLERQISNQTVRMLALRQPMAQDLRQIIAALKISSDIERIGDYSANVAKRAIALTQSPPMRPVGGIARMGRLVQQIIKDTLDAFSDNDAAKAIAAWKRDQEVDDMYNSLFRELLTYMMEDPRNIGPSTHLMFIAKNIERIGDHATNVAEIIHYLVRGEDIVEARPKSDKTSFTVVNAPEDKE
jgi:phosphate transport system protein